MVLRTSPQKLNAENGEICRGGAADTGHADGTPFSHDKTFLEHQSPPKRRQTKRSHPLFTILSCSQYVRSNFFCHQIYAEQSAQRHSKR